VKTKNFFIAGLFLVLFFCSAYAEVTPWADVWCNGAYYTTNGEDKNFRSTLLRSEGRFGFKLEDNSPATPYVVYYATLGQNENYWNNEFAYGVGVRALPFSSAEVKGPLLEWIKDIKLYGEILTLTFLKDGDTAKANKVKTDDFRYGIDVWHEWNLQNINRNLFWGEMWGNVSYRNTNFFDPMSGMDKFQTYLGYLQLKIGRHLFGGVRPYAAGYLTTSGNPQPWLNSFYYGLGIRMEPFREQENAPEILRKFKMFVEGLKISWLADQDPTRPTSDVRFGIDFTYGR